MFQDVTLFDNTIMENIRIGNKDATDEQVLAAARLANVDEFAVKLPDGWNTHIGENGCELSGGERQRIVLARVLLGNPKLIVMDNALPYLTTDLTDSEILSLAYRLLPLASSISISSHTVPASDCYYSANIRGMSVLVPDLPLIRQRLEEYLPLE